ncbi:hypothetical protein QJS10_CPB20g00561 [Acorus calamus]|uniref:Uncharacterized protein n=1 Tax=Acorus calamus TaxID=4465 RepID=A0AAV9CDG5_ACOCL|nr:hypothetical protein QJS10_CPB20g00561 [Acorus calamus]
MNNTLLAKWLWQWLVNPEVLWVHMWRERYGVGTGNHFPKLRNRASSLSKGRFLYKEQFSSAIQWKVGNDRTTLFWSDRWCGGTSLQTRFPALFLITADKALTVENYWKIHEGVGGWNVHFQ